MFIIERDIFKQFGEGNPQGGGNLGKAFNGGVFLPTLQLTDICGVFTCPLGQLLLTQTLLGAVGPQPFPNDVG